MLIKTKNTKFKIHLPIYMVFSVFLVFFIFLTNSVNVNAEGLSYTLPYNTYDYYDVNSLVSNSDVSNFITEQLIDFDPTQSIIDPSNCIYVLRSVSTGSTRSYVRVDILSDLTFNSTYPEGYNISINTVSFSNTGHNVGLEFWIYSDGTCEFAWCNRIAYADTLYTNSLFGGNATQTIYGLNYKPNYVFYSSGTFVDSSDNVIIYTLGNDPIPDEAIFEILDDFSDISSSISNVIDTTVSDLNNQKSFFDNLVSNLRNFFNSLKNWIFGGFSNLSSNIKNFFGPFLRNIQNYINEFKGNFENFADAWDHFFEIINSIYNMSLENGEFSLSKLISVLLVPSQEDLTNVFSGTPLYTLYSGIITAVSTFYTTISGVLNSNYVYVFSLPTFTFGGKTFTGLQFAFDWYIPYKSYGDAIISVFLIIAYIRFLMNFIPNFFYGSGFIDHDVNTIHGRTDSL